LKLIKNLLRPFYVRAYLLVSIIKDVYYFIKFQSYKIVILYFMKWKLRKLIFGTKFEAYLRQNRLFKKYLKTINQLQNNYDKNSYGLDDCLIKYINLDERVDRDTLIKSSFEQLNLNSYSRFSAIKESPGSLGCSKSHYDIVSSWKPKKNQLLMVCEDDIEFLLSKDQINEIINEFANNDKLSVLCLAYNHRLENPISPLLSISANIQTTGCYIIKDYMKPVLESTFQYSIDLHDAKINNGYSAIDQVWKILQTDFFFAITNLRAAYQRESYSDIENKIVNYKV